MKRIMLFIFISLFLITPVFAEGERNVLHFVEEEGGLYYESKFINENVFMKHLDMVPGKKYNDILYLENAAEDKYLLYFQIEDVNTELLKNIVMRIYINDEMIYNGLATGEDYYSDGINLRNVVCLGFIEPDTEYVMKVETYLSPSYTNTNNLDTSTIDWHFYAQYPAVDEPEPLPKPHPIEPDNPEPQEPDEPVKPSDNPGIVEILPIPNTGLAGGKYDSRIVTICALLGFGFSIIMFLIFRNKEEV